MLLTLGSKALTTVLLLFSISLAVTAQENFQSGYIVRGQTDTVRGKIDYRERVANPRSVTFLDAAGGKTAYGPGEISAFFVNGEIYRNYSIRVIPYINVTAH